MTDSANGKPPITFITKEFSEGNFKGFKYIVPQYSLQHAVDTFGAEAVESILNSQIVARVRTAVNNDLPENVKPDMVSVIIAKLLESHPDSVLFNQAQAEAWRPGVRELTSNQLWKNAKAKFEEAKAENDPTKKGALIDEAKALLAQASAKREAELMG